MENERSHYHRLTTTGRVLGVVLLERDTLRYLAGLRAVEGELLTCTGTFERRGMVEREIGGMAVAR